jgi:hypothetical protein
MDRQTPPFSWTIRLSLFKHPLLLKQLGLAIGIPFGVIIFILILTASQPPYLYYALGLIGLLMLLTGLVLLIVFRGTYDLEFVVSEQGITSRMQETQARRTGRINRAAILLGLFAGNYTTAGAGMLAESRQGQSLGWTRIRKVSWQPRRHIIILRAALGGTIVLFCLPDNYGPVGDFIQEKLNLKG